MSNRAAPCAIGTFLKSRALAHETRFELEDEMLNRSLAAHVVAV